MTRVVDASTVVAAFIDAGDLGEWARTAIAAVPIAAPAVMPAEAASAFRRAAARGAIGDHHASAVHHELGNLSVTLYGYDLVAPRAWELRENVTIYDAWYVALAELLDLPLFTLDERLARAPGSRCEVVTPATG